MKLFWKIYLAAVIPAIVIGSLATYIVAVYQLSNEKEHAIGANMLASKLIAGQIEKGYVEFRWPFDSLRKLSQRDDFLFWWIVTDDGTIHLANDTSFIGTGAYTYFPQVGPTPSNGKSVLDKKRNCGVVMAPFGKAKQWSFWLGFSLEDLGKLQSRIIQVSVLLLLSTVGMLAVAVYFAVKHFTKPIRTLAEGAATIGKGDLAHRVQVQSKDELGYLAESFNEMAEHLEQTTTSIDNLNREISQRKKAEEETQRSYDIQGVINRLLSLSLENVSLEDMLERAIDDITSIPWLSLESRGAIFLVEDDIEVLVMKAQRRLSMSLQTMCSSVPFGRCMCGRAALSGQTQFADHIDERHEHRYEGISAHGHYCVPIVSAGKVLGVINTYVKEGHTYNKKEEDFLRAVSAVLAGIIERKRGEQKQAELLKQLESANKELNDFAHIVSHDLKAPLRGIKTLANWISTDYADKFDQAGREQIDLLLGRVDRMHNLIDGILRYSRLGRVKEEKTKVDLNELVPNIIDLIAPPESITITIEDELPVIECEKTRITQVFQNLLSNAVKYMDKPQGQIRIGCVQEDGFWKFSVADNGPGIEEKYFEKIFQIFQTLSTRDEVESTGIGLTLVKKIVQMYGGRIWVESKIGEGSAFFFTLPKREMGGKNAELQVNIVSRR